ncbi:MAG: sigma-70 family RNA polymerase sigma factor [Oscillibacter sp.]|nr:sigma-70 family RNA polymerase sigma factor [Oscillibacter sp.]
MRPEEECFFVQLYQENFEKLERYAYVHLKNHSLSEEIAQDTFHEALQCLEDLLSHPNPAGWLMEAEKNKIKNFKRTKSNCAQFFLSINTDIGENSVSVSSAAALMEERESYHAAVAGIKRVLSEEEQNLLRWLVFDRRSHKEVAQDLGITVWTSQKRLERIREKLSKLFPGHRGKKYF